MAARFYLLLVVIYLFTTSLPNVHADTIVFKDGRVVRCDSSNDDGKTVRYRLGDAMFTVAREKIERIEKDSEQAQPLRTVTAPNTTKLSLSGTPALIRDSRSPVAVNSFDADTIAKLEANVRAAPNNMQQRIQLVNVLNTMADIEHEAGRYEKAKQLLLQALTWDSKNATTLTNLAAMELTEGRYQQVLNYAARATQSEANNQQAHYFLGAAHYALGQLPEAIKAWRAALKLGNDETISAILKKAEEEVVVTGNFTNGQRRFFNISVEGGTMDLPLETAITSLLDDYYGQLQRRFDYRPNEKLSVIFYRQTTFMDITNAPSWAGALNDGKLRVPIGGLNGVNAELARTLMHELTHSFIYLKTRGRCPAWLNEGLAQVMEGKSADRVALTELVTSKELPPLQSLNGEFTKLSMEKAATAYNYSLFATELLMGRNNSTVNAILQDLAENYNLNATLARHTRYANLETFEQVLIRKLME